MGEPFRVAAGKLYPSAAWFAGADANHDGMVTREEFRADALRFFKLLDVNGDGRLSDMEMHRYEVQVAPEIVAASVDTSNPDTGKDAEGDPKQAKLSTVRQGASFYGLLNDAEPVRSADRDFNMKVTQEEWVAAADRRFKALLPEGKDVLHFADLPTTPVQAVMAKHKGG